MKSETGCIKTGVHATELAQHPFKARARYLMPSGRYARWHTVQLETCGPVATFVYDARYGGPPPPGLADSVTLSRRAWGLPVRAA